MAGREACIVVDSLSEQAMLTSRNKMVMKRSDILKDITSWFPREAGWLWKEQDITYSNAVIVELFNKEEEGFILKGVAANNSPELELALSFHQWFHALGMAPNAHWCKSTATHDWLFMEQGEGIPAFQFPQTHRIGEILGKCLKKIHQLPISQFPVKENKMIALQEDAQLSHVPMDLVVSHGDFCLPNVLIAESEQVQIIDLGDAGLYDRYYDLYWGIWSLNFNGYPHQVRPFLESYGLPHPDERKLALMRELMNH